MMNIRSSCFVRYLLVLCIVSLIVLNSVFCEDDILESICSELENSSKAMLCKKDLNEVQPLSPLYQAVQGGSILDEVHFYPSGFLIRPRLQEDLFSNSSLPHSCEADQDAMTIVRVSNTTKRLLPEDQQLKVSQLSDQLINENVNSNLNLRKRKKSLNLDMVAAGAEQFHSCCLKSFAEKNVTNASIIPPENHNALEWRKSDDAKRCREIAESTFGEISKQLETMTRTKRQQEEKNQILRRVVAVWGNNSSRLAHLLLVFGCSELFSFDEFLACQILVGGVDLSINVHQRNMDAENIAGKPWVCDTCTIHQHPKWYASYVIAGQLAYSMTRPGCPKPSDLLSPLPTVEELEKDLPITGSSLIDQQGTRYYMGRTDVVWETTEVVQLSQGYSLLFSPLWYHRVIPPAENATHASMTLTVDFYNEKTISGTERQGDDYRLLIPREIRADSSDKLACFKLLDLYYALVDPTFDTKRGLGLFPCTKETMYHAYGIENFNTFADRNAQTVRNAKIVRVKKVVEDGDITEDDDIMEDEEEL